MLQNTSSKQLVTTLSSKGQITIPIEVRKHLGIDTNDKVAFVIDSGGVVQVKPAKYPDIQSLRGIAGSLLKPIPFKKIRQIAREERLTKKYGR